MVGLKKKLALWLVPAFLLVSSSALLVNGIPRFLHELSLVPGTHYFEKLNGGETLTDEEFAILEQSRLDALGFIELPKTNIQLGTIYYARAAGAQDAAEKHRYALLALNYLTEGLDKAPLNSLAWLRLASANTILGHERNAEAREAWRASIAVAPFDQFAFFGRIHLGIIMYPYLSGEDLALLKDQLSMAYRWHRGQLRGYLWHNKLKEWGVALSEPDSEQAEYLGTQP